MHITQISSEFQKLFEQNNLIYSLGKPASKEDVFRAEQKLDVIFPTQIRCFFESYNGLRVEEPQGLFGVLCKRDFLISVLFAKSQLFQ